MSRTSEEQSEADRVIHNLAEFLDWRGCGDDPYGWARAYYKYTDCGPWVQFLEEVEPARTMGAPHIDVTIRNVRGVPFLENVDSYPPTLTQFLGFNDEGASRKGLSWDEYARMVFAYAADDMKQGRTGRTVIVFSSCETELVLRCPTSKTYDTPAVVKRVYYEDLGRGTATLDPAKCVGIVFGSIVEGSDVEVGPFEHIFPFSTSEWEDDERRMVSETAYYWKRDNADWYTVRTDDDEWIVANVWGIIEWEGEVPPDAIRTAAEEAIKKDWQPSPEFPDSCVVRTIPKMPSIWSIPKKRDKEWQAMPLGATGAEIYAFENDNTWD